MLLVPPSGPINRTILELKRMFGWGGGNGFGAINRTILELKQQLYLSE